MPGNREMRQTSLPNEAGVHGADYQTIPLRDAARGRGTYSVPVPGRVSYSQTLRADAADYREEGEHHEP